MKLHVYIAACIVICMTWFYSCMPEELYYHFHSFEGSVWHKDTLVCFETSVTDTTSIYDVDIEIINDNSYPYKNLWLFVDYELPSGAMRSDTVECVLADDFGKWYGKGLSRYELAVTYDSNVKFARSGVYKYRIRQAMRDDELPGISDVGLRIVYKKER